MAATICDIGDREICIQRHSNFCSLQKVEIFSKLLRGLLFVLDDEQERLIQRQAPLVVCQQQADVVYFDIGGAPFSCNPVFLFIGIVQGAGMCVCTLYIFQVGACVFFYPHISILKSY